MRRLNGILEVLSHPDGRANYDRSLVEGDANWRRPAVPPDAVARRGPPDWGGLWYESGGWRATSVFDAARCGDPSLRPGWGSGARWRRHATVLSAAGLAAVLGLLVFCAQLPSRPPVPKPAPPAAAEPRPVSRPRARQTAPLRSSPPESTEAQDPPAETLARYTTPAPPQDPPSAVPVPMSPEWQAATTPVPYAADAMRRSFSAQAARQTAPTAAEDPVPSPPGEAPGGLAGDWLFVPANETGKSGYPPEFIELRLVEKQGVLHGRYRARYRVGDRAISPNVAFQFEGRAAAEGGVLPWRGPGGAQGEITLHLLKNGHLEVAWAAGLLGQDLGLISGTATLVRKLE